MRQIIKIIFITFFISMIYPLNVFSYGWGYKKSIDKRPPEIGEYKNLLENHEAIYMDESGEKALYLTFDNGYEQGYTEQVLDILKEENIPATFFVTGHYVKSAPNLVKRMVNDGHIVGNHSYTHPDFTKMSKPSVEKELKKLEDAVALITDQKEMKYVRPPRGTFNEKTLEWIDELNYIHVFWSLAFIDWKTEEQKGWQYAYDQIMEQIHPGAILLLHAVSSDNAQALQKVIADLKEAGYTFKSLDDLMLKKNPLIF